VQDRGLPGILIQVGSREAKGPSESRGKNTFKVINLDTDKSVKGQYIRSVID
jgi:hypothetical protein